jgi:hypothetical protein
MPEKHRLKGVRSPQSMKWLHGGLVRTHRRDHPRPTIQLDCHRANP